MVAQIAEYHRKFLSGKRFGSVCRFFAAHHSLKGCLRAQYLSLFPSDRMQVDHPNRHGALFVVIIDAQCARNIYPVAHCKRKLPHSHAEV